MSFQVSGAAYGRFMGRYSQPLAAAFADLVDVRPGQRVLDVGCGPGPLTEVLVQRVGTENVTAIDPSEPFVAAARELLPGVEVSRGTAENLPYADGSFDAALAQLVVHFMKAPVTGLQEMARVTLAGGTVAASVWNHAGGRGPLSLFWRAVKTVDPSGPDESGLAGVAEGQLGQLFTEAGMTDPIETSLTVELPHASFEEWWEPYTMGVGPAGDYVAKLDPAAVERLRATCEEMLPTPPFTVEAQAWTVLWRKPSAG